MKRTTILIIGICISCAWLTACKKVNNRPIKIKNQSILHGYILASKNDCSFGLAPCFYGSIGRQASDFTPIATLTGYIDYTTRGSFSDVDRCYYTLQPTFNPDFGRFILNRIDPSGGVKTFFPADGKAYSSVIFSPANKKLYCVMSGGGLCELVIGDSSYSAKCIAYTIHPMTNIYNSASITVNPVNGDIYVETRNSDLSELYVEKFHPGASATTIVATLTHPVLEMRFNTNDNMLYALQYPYPNINFVRIDPTNGKTDILSPIDEPIMGGFLSATLDPVSNTYIYASSFPRGDGYNAQLLYRRDMSGKVVQVDSTTAFYQGLDIEVISF